MSFSDGVQGQNALFYAFLGLKNAPFANIGPFLDLKKYRTTSSYMLVTIVDHN